METINILFCGTGGQGILTAAEVVALAAMYDGYHVKKSEVHGMAQRGGSVESHVRIGEKVFSPIIEAGQTDYLLSFEKGEHDRIACMLKQNGTDLFNEFVKAGKLISNPKFVNTYMLGVLAKHLSISNESWQKAMKESIKPQYLDKNIEVFMLGNKK